MSVYSVTSSVGVGEFGQPGPSPNAGQYKATATITTPGTNYPGTGGSGIPIVSVSYTHLTLPTIYSV